MDEPARRFPVFAVAWLAGTGALYLLTADANGVLAPTLKNAVAFRPADVFAAPWLFVPALLGVPFAQDAVQFAYVATMTALGLVALEWREGWRRAGFVFLAGGVTGVVFATFLVLLPLHAAFPTHPLVAFSVDRAYLGASTSAFAALGGLAGSLPRRAAGRALFAGVAAWELFLWAWYYDFAQLIPLYHYAALGVGFALTRSRAYRALPR